MTGELTLMGNKYTYGTDGKCGLNANNSDIAKVNAIYFADASESIGEGINFWRTASTWDNMTASAGIFYFGSNAGAEATLVGNAQLRAGQYVATDANGFRHTLGSGYGVFTRNDGSHFYLMLTDQGNPLGDWNSLRPFMMTLSSGDISFGTNCTFNNSIKTAGVNVHSNNYPGFTINNTSGQRLVTLFQTSNTGGFGNFTVRVYSAANTYTDASFGSNGYLSTKGLTLSDGNHGPLTIERSGTTYYASVRFKNSLGTLGYLGMTSVNGSLARLSADANTIYKLAEVRSWNGSTLALGTD